MIQRTLRIFTVVSGQQALGQRVVRRLVRRVVRSVSWCLRILLGCHMLVGRGPGRNVRCLSGINGRYSEGPPPGPASHVWLTVTVFVMRSADPHLSSQRSEDRDPVVLCNMAQSVSNYVEASSENCGHVKFLCPGVCQPCPTSPTHCPLPGTLEAKSLQNMDTFKLYPIMLLIALQSTNN